MKRALIIAMLIVLSCSSVTTAPDLFQNAYDGCDIGNVEVYDRERANRVVASCYANTLGLTTDIIYQCMELMGYNAGLSDKGATYALLECAS